MKWRETFTEKALKNRKKNPWIRFMIWGLVLSPWVAGIIVELWPKPKSLPLSAITTVTLPDPGSYLIFHETNPPSNLLINGERWVVGISPDLWGFAGLTFCGTRTILIAEGMMAPLSRDTMWHEIQHAILCTKKDVKKANWYKYADSKEHRWVYEQGMGLASFVHDNPEFMKWAEDWK